MISVGDLVFLRQHLKKGHTPNYCGLVLSVLVLPDGSERLKVKWTSTNRPVTHFRCDLVLVKQHFGGKL